MVQSDRRWLVSASIVYLIAIVSVQLLLNLPGGDVPFHAAIAAGAVVLSLRSSRAVRIWSVVATLVALALLVGDYREGVEFQIPERGGSRVSVRDRDIHNSRTATVGPTFEPEKFKKGYVSVSGHE